MYGGPPRLKAAPPGGRPGDQSKGFRNWHEVRMVPH